jgi:hypothetical protein
VQRAEYNICQIVNLPTRSAGGPADGLAHDTEYNNAVALAHHLAAR